MENKSYILLLNREAGFLRSLSQSLTAAGYPVLSADNKSGAIRLLTDHRIALIICDSELTDFNGYDFLDYLKKNSELKNIPFLFLISSLFVIDTLEEEVSKILKAFDLGAVDYIVDTLEGDISRVLIKRIQKFLTEDIRGKDTIAIPAKPIESTLSEPQDRRDGDRTTPRQVVNVQISRDGVLWVPGQITNISEQGLMIETSLLGKLGMPVFIRVSLPGAGYVTVETHIRHISIRQNPSSAEIGVEAQDSTEWISIYNCVAKLMGIATKAAEKNIPAVDDISRQEAAANIAPTQNGDRRYVYLDPLLQQINDSANDEALESKFYRSLIGKQLGNYKVVSFIGSGSMAGVFKGWDVLLERDVALKVISYKLSAIANYRDMFIREARLVSHLTHPNIAQIYHIDRMDDVHYFVMELISGGTLADMIKDRNRLNMAKCLEYFITTCRTLDFVSKQNIIHRDIKPANIMIDDRGIIKIVDFGIAMIDDDTNGKRKPEGFGSPLYMSPECILGRPLDACSDIYSLGATFYHVFAGEPPFNGDSDKIIIQKHLNEHLVPLRRKCPMVSDDLSEIIGKMMAKKPQERYANYRAIINDLTEVVH
ncbi:protein kinase [candidate division KSB1 bacterium]|nr:protein kinase [candidate division KSB1 bacterium]